MTVDALYEQTLPLIQEIESMGIESSKAIDLCKSISSKSLENSEIILQNIDQHIAKIHTSNVVGWKSLRTGIDFSNIDTAISFAGKLAFLETNTARIAFFSNIVRGAARHAKTLRNPDGTPHRDSIPYVEEKIARHEKLYSAIRPWLEDANTSNFLDGGMCDWYRLGLMLCLGGRFVAGPDTLYWWPPLKSDTERNLYFCASKVLISALSFPRGVAAVAANPGIIYQSLQSADLNTILPTLIETGEWRDHLQRALFPSYFRPSCYWLVYWSLIGASQQFSKFMEAFSQEDVATGALAGYLERWLTEWAAPKFDYFYDTPSWPFDLFALRLASSGGESISQADFGFIFDIDLPGYKLRKFLTIQAKISKLGKADVFSEGKQLTKLYRNNRKHCRELAVYAFYHEQQFGNYPAITVDTVVSVMEKVARIKENAKGWDVRLSQMEAKENSRWKVSTLASGWNFSEFMVYEFLNGTSNIGGKWTEYNDAFEGMKISDEKFGIEVLPKYVFVISMGREIQRKLVLEKIAEVMREPEIDVLNRFELPAELSTLRTELLDELRKYGEELQTAPEEPAFGKDATPQSKSKGPQQRW